MEQLFDASGNPVPKRRNPLFTPRIGIAVGGIVLLALSFYGGVAYQKGKTPATSPTATRQTDQSGSGSTGSFGGGFSRGNRAFGSVTSVDSSSITVSTRQGGSQTYTLTSSTTVTDNGQIAAISDIQSGDTVMLTLDSTNTKQVTAITLNPSFGPPGAATRNNTNSSSSDGTSAGTSSV